MSAAKNARIEESKKPYLLPIFFIRSAAGIVPAAMPTNMLVAGSVTRVGEGDISVPIKAPRRGTTLAEIPPIIWTRKRR